MTTQAIKSEMFLLILAKKKDGDFWAAVLRYMLLEQELKHRMFIQKHED